ncbi:MAG: hypothetical protein AAF443_08610 [Chlamydiota bacterium]
MDKKSFFLPLVAAFFSCFVQLLFAVEAIVKQRIGDGIGNDEQYTTIELFHAFEQTKVQPFLDLRYLIFEGSRQGANLGGGVGLSFSNRSRLARISHQLLKQTRFCNF